MGWFFSYKKEVGLSNQEGSIDLPDPKMDIKACEQTLITLLEKNSHIFNKGAEFRGLRFSKSGACTFIYLKDSLVCYVYISEVRRVVSYEHDLYSNVDMLNKIIDIAKCYIDREQAKLDARAESNLQKILSIEVDCNKTNEEGK